MGRAAVEKVVGRIIEHGKQQAALGKKPISEREARQTAQKIAIDADRKRGNESGGERR